MKKLLKIVFLSPLMLFFLAIGMAISGLTDWDNYPMTEEEEMNKFVYKS